MPVQRTKPFGRSGQDFVEIYWDLNVQLYRIKCPYDKNFVDELKGNIPFPERGWDATSKTWAFSIGFLHTVVEPLVQKYFPAAPMIFTSKEEAEEKAAKERPTSAAMTVNEHFMILFCRHLDVESLGAAFKNRARRLHPDAGGNASEFTEFNSAYQELRRILGNEPSK